MTKFAKELRSCREKAGWSIQKTSSKILVPRRTLEDWEASRRTPPEYVQFLVLDKLNSLIKESEIADESTLQYRLVRCAASFKNLKDVTPGASLVDENAVVLSSFGTDKIAAYAELNKHQSIIDRENTFTGALWSLTEFFVEEFEGDDDGEFISGSNFDHSAFPSCIHYDGSDYSFDVKHNAWVEELSEDDD